MLSLINLVKYDDQNVDLRSHWQGTYSDYNMQSK